MFLFNCYPGLCLRLPWGAVPADPGLIPVPLCPQARQGVTPKRRAERASSNSPITTTRNESQPTPEGSFSSFLSE